MPDFRKRLALDRNIGPLLFFAGLLAILFMTLKPFDFQFRQLTIGEYIAGYDIPPSSFLDFPRNIVLFLPLGFGLAAILDRRGWSKMSIRLTVLVSGFLLTLFVESLQHFIPTRQPSVADLIANTLGAVAGLACFRLWQIRKEVADWIRELLLAPRKVFVALAIYLLFLLLLALGLSSAVRLDGWNENYKMVLGNELTGNRRWLGSVQDLVIFNRSLEGEDARKLLRNPAEFTLSSNEGLLAYYPLTGGSKEPDLSGNQPDLIWQPTEEVETEKAVVQFDGKHWLETESPVRNLIQRLQETSQLAVRLSAATAGLNQKGPARIMSISQDPHLRNLTFGQEDNDLVMRYRSTLTGENGTSPQIVFPDFFAGFESVDFVVTFNNLSIDLIDSRSDSTQSIELVPGVAFSYAFLHLFQAEQSALNQAALARPVNNWAYRLFFYTLVLLPIGILLSLRAVATWPWEYRLILVIFSLLAVPILLEQALVYRSGLGLRPLNITISVLLIGFLAWIFIPAIRWLSGH